MADLDLTTLHARCSLSPALVGALVEAASVVMAAHHLAPPPPTPMRWVEEDQEQVARIIWTAPDERAKASHSNNKDATEDAACAVAIAAMQELGFRVVKRAFHGSGADYLMVKSGEPDNDFIKLEVSGIFQGGDLRKRLRVKIDQVGGGQLNRPGRAVVVQFEEPAIAIGRWA